LKSPTTLDIQPEIRLPRALTSTLESSPRPTIVFSRTCRVLPDEASLATMVAARSITCLSRSFGSQPIRHSFDRLLFDEKDTFKHFGFSALPRQKKMPECQGGRVSQELALTKTNSSRARLFPRCSADSPEDIPNLISPHLGDRVPVKFSACLIGGARLHRNRRMQPIQDTAATQIVALPLAGASRWTVGRQARDAKVQTGGCRGRTREDAVEVHAILLYLTQ